MGRRGLSLQERSPEPQVRFKMNEHGKVQVDQSETYGSGSMGRVSAEVPKRQWVRRTSIPTIETSLENFLLRMEYVCSQAIPGSGSPVSGNIGTKNESVTDVLKLRGVLTKSSK